MSETAPFVYAVLDVRDRLADAALAERCRELTFAWSRWSYAGPIVEHADPQQLLALALARGARYCLVQAAGHLVVETLRPKGAAAPELVDLLINALGDNDWLVGRAAADGALRDSCWLVDLQRWDARGRPALRRETAQPLLRSVHGDGIAAFPPAALALGRELQPEKPPHAQALNGAPEEANIAALAPELGSFVSALARTLERSRRGVFVWNLEGYEDLHSLPADEPLAALYSVAAGFKPNAILRACGFRPGARVVFFDYSADALALRRELVEHWDGRDLPAFLWPRLQPGKTHYWLRSTAQDQAPAREELDQLWARELQDWGGADSFAAHWQLTRRLRHEYLLVDLLNTPQQALAAPPQGPAVVWWSNAFSSVHALWHLRYAQRAAAFGRWIQLLAQHCPQACLLGADADNTPVAGIRAADYAALLAGWRGGMHEPLRSAAVAAAVRY
jgi:hypothetical protein